MKGGLTAICAIVDGRKNDMCSYNDKSPVNLDEIIELGIKDEFSRVSGKAVESVQSPYSMYGAGKALSTSILLKHREEGLDIC